MVIYNWRYHFFLLLFTPYFLDLSSENSKTQKSHTTTKVKRKRLKNLQSHKNNEQEIKLIRLAKQNEEDGQIREFFKLDCELCLEKFSKFYEVSAHYRKVHSIRRGYVGCCNKKFTRRTQLLEHMYWHTNPDAFK